MGGRCLVLLLGGHGRARDLLPDLESLGHLLAIRRCEEPVTSQAEVLAALSQTSILEPISEKHLRENPTFPRI